MKKHIKASTTHHYIKCVYMTGTDEAEPEMRTVAIARSDLGNALMSLCKALYLNVNYDVYELDTDELDTDDLIDNIVYNNTTDGGYDYIFQLVIDDDEVINNYVGLQNL